MLRLISSRLAYAALIFAIAVSAHSKDPARERGVLAEMQSVSCGYMQKSGSTVAGVLITGAQHTKSRELLCQEYVVKSDRVTYRIRPKEEKHPVLLRVGEEVEFRLKKDELLLRVPESDNKEREYFVVAMIASPELTNAINQTQHPPKSHGTKLKIDPDNATPDPPPPESHHSPSGEGAPIEVSSSAPAQPSSTAPPSASSLKIDSTPPGAEIFIDSSAAGHTPALINVQPGTHSVQVVLPGFKDWVSNVTVPPASQQQLNANLSRL